MSLSKKSSNDSSQPTRQSGIKINQKFMLKLINGLPTISKDFMDSCKVLHFSSQWKFEDVLATIDGLTAKEYPQLFVFMVQANLGYTAKHQPDSFEKLVQLQQKLLNFSGTRPIILQFTFCKDKKTMIFYKNEFLSQFCGIDKADRFCNFLTLLESFSGETQILNSLSEFNDRSLAIRFLQSMVLSEEFFTDLVLNVAATGTKAELLAALDAPFNDQGRILGSKAQQYILSAFKDDEDAENIDSVLLQAVENKNKEVIDYLISYWTHLIQQLPFDHQVQVSKASFKSNKLDVLCDLLDIGDFPFPVNFNIDSVCYEKLQQIIKERVNFHAAIEAENFVEINEFIKANQSLKFVYDPSNNSALMRAIKAKKNTVFYYLKSLGFEGVKCDDMLQQLSDEEQKQAKNLASEQRKKNINKSLFNVHRAVFKLCMQSFIHNRRISNEQEAEYRKIIMKWFTDIYKIAPEMLGVAATSDDLRIIFDFESFWVENASLQGSYSSGTLFPYLKCIFIGSKLTDNCGNYTSQREQKIKGVLAHEICHFVMQLVYENDENPYFQNQSNRKQLFTSIVNTIDKWSAVNERPDDECNGIIFTVYILYGPEEFHLELIVRAVQMLVTFDDNETKSQHLQNIYRILFDFWQNQVIPDLQRFLSKDQRVVKLNGFAGMLRNISKSKFKINPVANIENLINSKLTIITTNSTTLLFIDICKQLKEIYDVLMDSKNFFIDQERFENLQIKNELHQICQYNQELNVLTDCSSAVPSSLGNLFNNKAQSFTIVVSNENQCQELKEICEKKDMKNAEELTINYNWSDLTTKAQNSLLKTKINFQNSQVLLNDLLKNENGQSRDLSQAIDTQLLNALIKKEKIAINTKSQIESNEKNFEFVFQERKFLQKKVEKNYSETQKKQHINENKNLPIKTQDELLVEVKGQKYVLVSDQAGNGKSWTMKKIAMALMQQNPTKWVTYVDLKQYIEEFKIQMIKGNQPNLVEFMVENILKQLQLFEVNIFQKLYRDGKAIILFDGFDEIAPNYAEFVSKLAQDLLYNGGNQLWMATRDFFEVDLQQKLRLDVTYSLKEMGVEKGIDMIVRSWILMDLDKVKKGPASKNSFDEYIESLPEYKGYQQKADQLVKKAKISRSDSVGLPQLFKMIADAFKDEENVDDLEGTKIYEKFLRALYVRWSDEKGQIRKDASIDSQRFKYNFYKFHQFHAISSLFPKSAKNLFRKYNGKEWQATEIIACGILTIIDEKIYFVHETFREYFIADFLAEELEESDVDEEIVKILADVLTDEKFSMIRIFLNDLIKDSSNLIQVQDQMRDHIAKFNEMKSFADFFPKNLTKLVDLIIGVLKNGDYDKVKDILKKYSWHICEKTYNSEIFLKYQNFLINFLQADDLKDLIISNKLFHQIIKSSMDASIFEGFVTEVGSKTNQELVKQGLLLEGRGDEDGKIAYQLASSADLNPQKIKQFLKFMENFLTITELIDLIRNCNYKKENIIQISLNLKHVKNLRILWSEVKNYLGNEGFKKFLKLYNRFDHYNILHSAATQDHIEVHDILWELLLNTFENREELKDFIFQKDKNGYCFLEFLISCNQNEAVVALTFKHLKKNFSQAEYEKIINPKFINCINLLQIAACNSKSIKVHEFLWEFFQNFCGTKEKFLEMIKAVGQSKRNTLHHAAMNKSSIAFKFLIQKLEKIASRDEIRAMLKNLSIYKRNLLQTAACEIFLEEDKLHEEMWKALRKYFDRSEIVLFIVNRDVNGENLLFNAFTLMNCTGVVQNLTFNNIKNILNHEEQIRYMNERNNKGDNFAQHTRRELRISFGDKKKTKNEDDLPFDIITEFV